MIVDSFIRQCNTIFHIRIKQFVFSKPQHSIDQYILYFHNYTDHAVCVFQTTTQLRSIQLVITFTFARHFVERAISGTPMN